jgi:hypothetical protein
VLPFVAFAMCLFPANRPLISSDFLPHEDRPLLTRVTSWKTTANIQFPPAELMDVLTWHGRTLLTGYKVDQIYWVASLLTGDGSGRLESIPFPAPRWISLTVTGDLTRSGNDVYFLLTGEGKRLPIRVHTEDRHWRRVTLALPSDWVGKSMQLVAESGPRDVQNWFAFSNPTALGTGTVLANQVEALAMFPAFAVAFFLFLLPGVLPAAYLTRLGSARPLLALPLTIIFGSFFGYLAFWAYLFSPLVGRCFGIAILLGSAAWLMLELWRGQVVRPLLMAKEVLTPLALTCLVGLFYLALTYSVDLEAGLEAQPNLRFFEFMLEVDNDIPYFFAEPLYIGHDVRRSFPVRVPGWQSSDRPPLQAGLLLLQMPIGSLLGQPRLYALAVDIAVQCVWVPAVWCLWTAAGLPRQRAGLALLFLVLSGFTLINTVFAWPKLLAGGLTVFAVILALFDRAGQTFSLGRASLLGLAAGLGSLGHGGVAFTLLPFGLMMLLPRWYPGLSRLMAAAAVYLALLGPWFLYQKAYDPPGTRLLKLHLTGDYSLGDDETWQDSRSLWQNLVVAYRSIGLQRALANKLENLKVLFAAAPDQFPWPTCEQLALPSDSTGFRRCDFMALFWSLGLLNLGWIVALVRLTRRSDGVSPVLGVAIPLLALASTATWVLILFHPGGSVIHQGSYATFLLLFAALAAWLTTLPARVVYLLLAAQAGLFTWGWIATSPANSYGPPNVFMILVAVFWFGLLVVVAIGNKSSHVTPLPDAAPPG